MQLVQLQNAKTRFAAKGIGLAAISYDNQKILADFSQRAKIDFPLLADPGSAVLRKFHAVDAEATAVYQGMAHPGYIYLDAQGKVLESQFDKTYNQRSTANRLLASIFPELLEGQSRDVPAKHIALRLKQTDQVAGPGSRVTLVAEITLDKNVHVYAPGVQGGYKPIELLLDRSSDYQAAMAAVYPQSRMLRLEAIHETVPVFENTFQIRQDLVINGTGEWIEAHPSATTVTVHGRLRYQACDDKICYLPMDAPVSWQIEVLPLDRQRAPVGARH